MAQTAKLIWVSANVILGFAGNITPYRHIGCFSFPAPFQSRFQVVNFVFLLIYSYYGYYHFPEAARVNGESLWFGTSIVAETTHIMVGRAHACQII